MDFGFHPGQDRLPREAAILKNCIITNKEGSAAIFQDVPIADEFKFNERKSSHEKIRVKIDQIFDSFPKELKKFERYREIFCILKKKNTLVKLLICLINF